MTIQTTRWDSAEHLKTDEDIQLYLEACLEESEDDPALLLHALNVVARAKNMHRENFDQSEPQGELCLDDDPTFTAIAKAMKALGFKLTIQPTVT